MDEIWKDIDGFNGDYQVSTQGRIRSFKRKKIMYLKPQLVNGYERVHLNCDNKKHYLFVHRIVATAFIPNPKNKPEVNHLDENPRNNNVTNLDWVTSKENKQWGTSLQRRSLSQRKTHNPKAVYQFDKSLNLINVFPSRNEAARSLGFDKGGIGHACHQDYKFTTYKGFIWRYEEDARKIIQKDVCT